MYICLIYRSASFIAGENECGLSDMDRFSATARSAYTAGEGAEYFETNCIDDPVKMCDFQRTEGRILKTVDAVFQVEFYCLSWFCYRSLLNISLFSKFLWLYKVSILVFSSIKIVFYDFWKSFQSLRSSFRTYLVLSVIYDTLCHFTRQI